ncbi:MAG TPA: segregation/condensation protein A [Clostridiaceae bacterium]|nr:segregation/condensation protein A [Clostridiaceae bacterium]
MDLEGTQAKGYKIKIQNFEGPFDLLFHLIEKNQINIYDIPISEITDQYLDYLSDMQELDLEFASEFLVMASTLLHIKSRMLLPDKDKKVENDEEDDPREELVLKLVEYKKYKDLALTLKERELQWNKAFYKPPEHFEFEHGYENETLELSAEELRRTYIGLLQRNASKINKNAGEFSRIIPHEKVSLKSKMYEVVRMLFKRTFFQFTELFSLKKRSKTEVVTGFLAILELAKLKKVKIFQKKQFSKILVYRADRQENIESEVAIVENGTTRN